MIELPSCSWCDRPFRPRQSGGRAQRFCRPSCRRAFHAAMRAWALNAIAQGRLTLADVKNNAPTTRALLVDPNLTVSVPEVPRPLSRAPAIADETTLAADELGALLGNILDAVSPEELGRLPEPVWALLD